MSNLRGPVLLIKLDARCREIEDEMRAWHASTVHDWATIKAKLDYLGARLDEAQSIRDLVASMV